VTSAAPSTEIHISRTGSMLVLILQSLHHDKCLKSETV